MNAEVIQIEPVEGNRPRSTYTIAPGERKMSAPPADKVRLFERAGRRQLRDFRIAETCERHEDL